MKDLFYRNRRLLMLVLALIVVGGLSSIMVLPRLEDPILQQRAALVFTNFPGANAVRVETLVTETLEESLREIEEIRILRSDSRDEQSTITIELHDHVTGVAEIWSRVRDKLNDVTALLPDGSSEPVFIDLKFSAYAALYSMKWTGQGPANYAVMTRYAEAFEQELRTMPGTDDVDLFGLPEEEIVVEVDHYNMANLGLTPEDIAGAINASDAKVSAGGIRNDNSDIVVEVESEFETLQRISNSPVKAGNDGQVVSLGDIATIDKAIQDPPSTRALVDGEQSVVVGCFIQPQVRIDLWTADAARLLERFRKTLPEGISVDTIFIQDRYVTRRLAGLLWNLTMGASAVTLVILFMMGWRSALIIGSALPMAGLMVLAGLRFMGIPLHQMSVTGLIIALGLLIDNAIVAVDEMRVRLQQGLKTTAAIRATVSHLTIPLLGSTFTTCLAFAPLALMPGPAGEFVGSIAVSVILAVTASLFLSLTIVPSLVGILRRNFSNQSRPGLLQQGFGNQRLYRFYRSSLDFLFRRPAIGVVLGVVFPIAGFYGITQLPEQFFPPSDREQFQLTLQLPPQASIFETIEQAKLARKYALELDEIKRVHWFVGESAPAFYYNMLPVRSGLPNYAQGMVQCDAGVDMTKVVHRVQSKLQDRFPGTQVIAKPLEQGPPVDAPIMVRVFGNDLPTINQVGDDLRLMLSKIPDVVATVSNVGSSTSKLSLDVDEDQASLVGLSHLGIANQLRTSLDGQIGGSLVEGTEVLPVRIKLNRDQRTTSQDLQSLNLVSGAASQGQSGLVPVQSVANWKLVPATNSIERLNGYRMNEIQVHVKAGVLSSKVQGQFQQLLSESGYQPPPGVSIDFAGNSAERNRAVGNLLANAGILVVLMVAGLVLSFQSFRLAGLIGVVGALSVGLGLAALWWFEFAFSFMSIVGIMGLVGVAINDTIVVLAAIRSDQQANAGQPTAVAKVVFHSTRHVLATTLTTIAGFIPLILAGGGFWPPLAVAIAGGVAGATILALYFAPSVYLLMFRCRENQVFGPQSTVTPLQQAN